MGVEITRNDHVCLVRRGFTFEKAGDDESLVLPIGLAVQLEPRRMVGEQQAWPERLGHVDPGEQGRTERRRRGLVAGRDVQLTHRGDRPSVGDRVALTVIESNGVMNDVVVPAEDIARLAGSAGFRAHSARPEPAGWTVSEVWNSEPEFRAFFDANVKANLPPGVEPDVRELHNVLLRS